MKKQPFNLNDNLTSDQKNFLVKINHELRTPMNAMLGLTHLLKRTNLDQVQHSYIEQIERNTNELNHIISNFLDTNRLQTDKKNINQITFSVISLFNNLLEDFFPQANEKSLSLYFEVEDELESYFLGDAEKIKQVLSHLISNAIKFTNQGSIRIRCEVLENKDLEQKLVFKVIDSGMGIPADRINNIFKPFMKEDEGIKKKYYTKGLGLSICKNYIDAMQGKIGVRSEPEIGSDFYFVLTLKKSVLAASDIVTFSKEEKESIVYTEYRSKKRETINKNLCCKDILLADDDEVNLEITSALMKNWGVFVHKAKDGQEVIDFLKEKSADLVIMDLKMPKKDGYQTTQEIRELYPKETLPVILLSGINFLEEYDYLDRELFNDFLMKPIDPTKLLSTVNELFELKKDKISEKNDLSDINFEIRLDDSMFKRDLFSLLTTVEKRNPLKIEDSFSEITNSYPDFKYSEEYCYLKSNLDSYDYEKIISCLRKVLKE